MLRTMRAPANAEVMFHFLALSEMTAARCTVKAIHENEGLFCRLMKLSHTIATSRPTRALDDPGMLPD